MGEPGNRAPGAPRDVASAATLDGRAVGALRPDGRPVGELARGEELAHFIVLEKLGQGGMGVVYAAYDPRLDRKVALKLLLPEDRGEGESAGSRRLLREAQAMARLTHENVVVVHEVGKVADQVYVAMEHVDGGTARQWLARAPRTWREVVTAYCGAGRGLAAAHARGLVHRDFKPENVLVGSDGRMRVTDFGLVGIAEAALAAGPALPEAAARASGQAILSSPLTQQGSVVGTLGYIAPEVHQGRGADARADQFAFCVSLYEALYGTMPFAGATAAELAAAVIAGRLVPPPPDTKVPAWVHQVLLRGLARDPAARYPSMDALLAALQADPIAARRRRLRTALVGLGFAGAVALAAFGLVRGAGPARLCADAATPLRPVWNEARAATLRQTFAASGVPYAAATAQTVGRALDAYAQRWAAMRRAACEATRVSGVQSEAVLDVRMRCLDRRLAELRALTDVLVGEPDAKVVEHAVQATTGLVDVAVCADVATLTAAVRLPDDPRLRRRVETLEGRVDRLAALTSAGRIATAAALAPAVVAEARRVAWPRLQSRALMKDAELLEQQRKLEQAEARFREALPLAARAGDDRQVADLYLRLVWLVGHLRAQPQRARQLLLSAETAVARAGDAPAQRAGYLRALGSVDDAEGRYKEALTHYRQSADLLAASRGPHHPDTAQSLNDVAVILDLQGRRTEALAIYRRLLADDEARYGKDHPRVARLLNNIAVALQSEGQLDEALASYDRALAIWRRAYGERHAMVAITLLNRGVILEKRKRPAQARASYEAARRIWEHAQGRDRGHLGTALTNIGDLLEKAGKCPEALTYYQRALRELETALGKNHPDTTYPLLGIGSCHLALGDPRGALAPLEHVVAVRRAQDVDAGERAEGELALARALWGVGQRARARPLAVGAYLAAVRAGAGAQAERARLETWLRGHGGLPRPPPGPATAPARRPGAPPPTGSPADRTSPRPG